MKNVFRLLGVLLVLTLVGCSSLQKKEMPKMAGSVESTRVMDAIAESFKANGYNVKNFDTKYGIIETSWKEFDSSADMTSTVVDLAKNVMGKKKGITAYSRELMFKAKITEDGYTIVTQVKKKSDTIGEDFGSDTEQTNAEEGSEEGNLAESIASAINEKLGKKNMMKWGWTGLNVNLK